MRMSLLLASTMWFPMDDRDHPKPHPPHTPHGVSTGRGEGVAQTKHQQCFGGHSERETPGHIPNPEAKTLSADGTAGETPWESRTPPDFFCRRGHLHPKMASSHLCALVRPSASCIGRHRRRPAAFLAGSV